jgi:MtrB/PioB family decaheme-associated outer membrane protein
MKRKLIFACIFSLLLLSYAYAEDDKPLSGGIFLGGRAISGQESANFNKFNGITPGLFGGGDIHYEKGGYYLNADGAVLGDDDMYIKARGGKWGSFKYSLYYTEFPNNISFQNRSLFATPGSQNQTFSGNGSATGVTDVSRWGSQSFDYKVRWKDVGGAFDLSAVKPFFISVQANQLRKEGQNVWAATSGQSSFKAAEFAVPVDNRTSNISALAGWKNKQYYVALGGGYSQFTNDAEFTTFRDPFTTGSTIANGVAVTAPDNKSWNVKLTGTAKLPLASTFAATGGYQRNTSETNILTSIDQAGAIPQALTLNRGTFHGDVEYWNVNASLTSNPWKSLTTKLYFYYLDKKNKSDGVAFSTPSVAGSVPVTSEIFDYQKTTLGAEGAYRFTKNLKGILGYEYTDVRRRASEFESSEPSEGSFHGTERQIPDQWDNKFTGQIVYNPTEWLGTRVKYQKLYRNVQFNMNALDSTSTDYNTQFALAQANQMRRYDIGNKEQDMLKLTVDLTPMQDLDVAVEYAYKRDKLTKEALGYQDMTRNEFIIDATYTWKDFKFFGFFDWDSSSTNQLSRQGSGAAGQSPSMNAAPTTTNFNFTAELKNDNYAYGLGVVAPIVKKKLNLILQYDFEKNNGNADFTSQSFTAANTTAGVNNNNISIPPWDDYTRQSISARLVYAVTKDLGLTFGYLYSQFKLNDGQSAGYSNVPLSTTGVPLNMLLTGAYQDQSYNVNLFYLKAMYKF